MEFRYTVLDKTGKRIKAKAKADSHLVLLNQLKGQGLLPIEIKPIGYNRIASGIKNIGIIRKELGKRELAVFTRQLASALKAGILLSDALETIGEDWQNDDFREIIKRVIAEIRAGKSFSLTLAKFPQYFSLTYIALVKAGEQTGNLGLTLGNLAKYLEDVARTIQKIKTATRYPLFIFGFFLFAVFVIVFFIIPKFEAIFVSSGISLPLLTRVVVGISKFIIKYIFWLILFVAGFAFTCGFFLKKPRVRFWVDRYKLKIPIFGDILMKSLISRFARTLSILMSGEAGLASSLIISSEVTNNFYLKSAIDKIRKRVLAGFSLSQEMESQKIFHKMFVKMVQVGEKTGKIGDMLEYNADYYDEELETAITNFTSLLEPVLIVLIGGVVLVVILALYLPIFKMAAIKR